MSIVVDGRTLGRVALIDDDPDVLRLFTRMLRACDETLSKKMAALCDVFVMDAFGTAHRAQASTSGVAEFAPVACAGPLLARELDALGRAMRYPARPLVAIIGGAKVSTKLSVLEALADKVDQLIVGGGIANTFIAATGHEVHVLVAPAGLRVLDTVDRAPDFRSLGHDLVAPPADFAVLPTRHPKRCLPCRADPPAGHLARQLA